MVGPPTQLWEVKTLFHAVCYIQQFDSETPFFEWWSLEISKGYAQKKPGDDQLLICIWFA